MKRQDNISRSFISGFVLYFQQERRLDLVTITHPDNLQEGSKKRMVFVTARVHPGETPSSFVCQGKYYLLFRAMYKVKDFSFNS